MALMMLTVFMFLIYFDLTVSSQYAKTNKTPFVQPTVINSTGEYYISNTSQQFQNQIIQCNSSISDHCFVICQNKEACSKTNILCSSPLCDIKCTGPGNHYGDPCDGMNFTGSNNINATLRTRIQCLGNYSCKWVLINIMNSNNSSVMCSGNQSCYGLNIIGSSNQNSSFYFECSGNDSCGLINVHTMNSKQSSIVCNGEDSCCGEISSLENSNNISYLSISVNGGGYTGCGFLWITPSSFTMLNVELYGGYGGPTIQLIQSAFTNHTNIICDSPKSCRHMIVFIQQSVQHDFNMNITVNGYQNKFGYIYVSIYCIHGYTIQNHKIIDCTNFTAFPIFDIAVPSAVDSNNIYYNSSGVHWYRYQAIILDESPENVSNLNYHIECKNDYSCSETFIHFKPKIDSNLSISCIGDYSCAVNTIYSMPTNNSNVSMLCEGNSCYENVSINIFSGNNMVVYCKSEGSCGMDIHGSIGISLYLYFDADGPIYIDARNAKLLNLTLNSHIDSAGYYKRISIYGPISNQSIFNLSCDNFGCQQFDLYLLNGLNDVNISFIGDCDECYLNADNYTDCMHYWNINCGDSYWLSSTLHQWECRPNNTCCIQDTAEKIEKGFTEYWFDFECPVTPVSIDYMLIIKYIGLIIGGIIIGGIMVIITKKNFICIDCKCYVRSKRKATGSQYQKINK